MKILTILFVLVPMLLFANGPKMHYQYRKSPEVGEWVVISGVGIIALSAIAKMTRIQRSKEIGYLGGAICVIGVKLDLGKKKHHRKK